MSDEHLALLMIYLHCPRWLYGMNLAMDANFRLKLKERGVTDPEFGPGWAYFVNDEVYKAEIIKHPQPIEVSIKRSRVLLKTDRKILEKRLYLFSSSYRTGYVKTKRRILSNRDRGSYMLQARVGPSERRWRPAARGKVIH